MKKIMTKGEYVFMSVVSILAIVFFVSIGVLLLTSGENRFEGLVLLALGLLIIPGGIIHNSQNYRNIKANLPVSDELLQQINLRADALSYRSAIYLFIIAEALNEYYPKYHWNTAYFIAILIVFDIFFLFYHFKGIPNEK